MTDIVELLQAEPCLLCRRAADEIKNLRMYVQQVTVLKGKVGKLNLELIAEMARLRRAIQDYLDGNYPPRQRSKQDKCRHGSYRYESCEACTDDYFAAVLAGTMAESASVEPLPLKD